MLLTNERFAVQKVKCPECGSKYVRIVEGVYDDGEPLCLLTIEGHRHEWGNELYFLATFGTWDDTGAYDDHVTFLSRYGFIEGEEDAACSLVQCTRDAPELGRRLSRAQALKHPLQHIYWHVVDHFVDEVYAREFHNFIYHDSNVLQRLWLKGKLHIG